VALPTLSFHLKELVTADLVTSQSVSRFVIYRANYSQMNGLLDYLTANCCCGVPTTAGNSASPGCSDDACAPQPERSPS